MKISARRDCWLVAEKTARDYLVEAYTPKKPDESTKQEPETKPEDNNTEDLLEELASPYLYLRKGYERGDE